MDFSQFDQRGRDEAGTPHPILHPDTGVAIVDPDTGNPCMVIVRGPTAATVVAAENARARSGMFDPGWQDHKTIAEMHDVAVQVALPFIAGFENVMRGDRPATEADAAWFLGMNMPKLKIEADGSGSMANRPFAEQICDIVNVLKAELGNAPAP